MQELQDITVVTIPIPQPFTTPNFGVHSTTFHGADRNTQRYSEADIALIKKHAAILEVTPSTFIKECAINVAKALEAKKERAHGSPPHDLRSG